jgi:hypothetical protein
LASPSTTTLRGTAIWLAVVAALGLTACGGSSKAKTGTTAGAAAAARTPGTATTGTTSTKTSPSAAAVAYRKCLEAHGAGLPRLVPGPNGSVALGRLEPPKGVSRKTYDAAVKACGGSTGATSPVSAAVKRFVECMRGNGVHVPSPGKGKSLFSYLGDVKNPKFGPALRKCGAVLREASGASG